MTESDTEDRTDEIREDIEDGDALGGDTDGADGAILTLDADEGEE